MVEKLIRNIPGKSIKPILDMPVNLSLDLVKSTYKTFNLKKEVWVEAFQNKAYILEDGQVLLSVRLAGVWETEREFLEKAEQMTLDEGYKNSQLLAYATVKQIAKDLQ